MAINSEQAVRLGIGLIWPVVVVVLASVFRRELRALLEGAAGLIRGGGLSKISLPGGIAFELAKTTEYKIDWSGPGGGDLRNTVGIVQFASGVPDMLALLKPQQPTLSADYAVFDLGTGHEWLTSRLHLFSLLLRRMHGLRYCVFVYDTPEVRTRFLGFASTESVRWALAIRNQHLERAAHRAFLGLGDERITSRTGAIDPQTAPFFINEYLKGIQISLLLSTADFAKDIQGFAKNLLQEQGLFGFLRTQMPMIALDALRGGPKWEHQLNPVVDALNKVIEQQLIYEETRFSGVQLSDATKNLMALMPEGDDRIVLNRLLLRDAYPQFVAQVLPEAVPSFNPKDWVKLQTRDTSGVLRTTLECARWIDRTSAEVLLGSDLGRTQVPITSLQAASRKDQVSLILRAEGAMVALVGEGGRFERLIDRLALAARAIEFYL